MSSYTTEVRYICETLAGLDESVGYNSVQDVIDASWDKVFDFDFPIFDESYRPVLCKKILKRYYVREIGEETVGLWKLRLDSRMNEIMPYYNKLYEAWNQELNLFDDTNMHKESTRDYESDKGGHKNTVNTADTTTANLQTFNDGITEHHEADNTQRNLFSDTPQGALTGVNNETYLTDARKIHDDIDEDSTRTHTGTVRTDGNDSLEASETENTTEEFDSTDTYVEHIFGKSGGLSYIELLMKYRDALINIDVMIIDELRDLFMNIW